MAAQRQRLDAAVCDDAQRGEQGMIRIVNPECFYLDSEDFQALRDVCELATYFSKGQRLATMMGNRHEKAVALASEILKLPIFFEPREEQS